MLDTARDLETPEGIELSLRVAGPLPRGLAWGVDALIRLALYWILAFLLLPLESYGLGLLLVALFLLEWLYPVLFELYLAGATPGKRMLGLRVLHDDGTPVAWSASLVRNILRFVDFLPVMYTTGLVAMLLHPHFKRLGDLAAGTLVVYTETGDPPPAASAGEPYAPWFALRPEEQQALLDFAERRALLTPERADELARCTGPLVADSADPAGRLAAIGAWVAGQR